MNFDVEKLVRCVEARPAIWDTTLMDYGNRTVVDKLWEEISIEMQSSVAACKVKWAYLRNSYNRAVREGNAASVTGGKRKKWYLMDAMAFLKNFVKVGRQSGVYSEDCTPDTQEYSDYFGGNGELPEEKCSVSLGGLSHGLKTENIVFQNQSDEISDDIIHRNSHNLEEEDTSMTFFRSLIPDVNKLNETRKRKFKLEVFALLDKELQQQETEQTCK